MWKLIKQKWKAFYLETRPQNTEELKIKSQVSNYFHM